jgi:simple sugar transport system permease protein
MKRMFKKSETYLFLIIILFSVIITAINRSFLTLENFFDLAKSYSFMGIMACGVLVVIISGGLDLSFTAIATVAEYVMASVVISLGGNGLTCFLIASALGIALGLINAWLVYYVRIPAVIATIATMNIFYGILIMASGGKWIYSLPEWFSSFAQVRLFSLVNANGIEYGLSIITVIWIVVMLLTSFLLRHTVTGRGVYALGGCGSDRGPIERAGFNVRRIHAFIYAYMGFLAGIAGVVQALLVQTVAPNSIVGKELNIIAAVILGGASISGGAGSVTGTILGVMLIAIMNNGLTLMRVPSYWSDVLIGGIIIVSVVVNALRMKRQNVKVIDIEEQEVWAAKN